MKTETLKTAAAIIAVAITDPDERKEALELLNSNSRDKDKMLTTKAACQLADVCPRTLFNWEKRGLLKAHRATRSHVRWSMRALETFLCDKVEG